MSQKHIRDMHTRPKKRLGKSRLIRVLNRLNTLCDPEEITEIQKCLNRLHMRHSVCCRSGRLELMADLIAESRDRLNRPEKKALDLMAQEIRKEAADPALFLDFSRDYLIRTIGDSTLPAPLLPAGRISRQQAAKTVAALSLTGLVMAGCTQQKNCARSVPLKNEKAGPVCVQTGASGKSSESAPVSPAPDPAHETAMQQSRFFTYFVKPGDNLKKIAAKTGADCAEVARLNSIRYDSKRNWYVLHPGQKLLIRKAGEAPEPVVSRETNSTPDAFLKLKKSETAGAALIHFVARGDSLWEIARKYRVPMEEIAAANHIRDPRRIRYGSILKIPGKTADEKNRLAFHRMSRKQKIDFIRERTIKEGRQYVDTIVEMAEAYDIDPRLYASLIWEESWFDSNARSKDNCRKLAQLDPRFHDVSPDIRNNFRKSLGYLRHEFVYYRKKGFDQKSSALCALAAYNGGDTRIRRLIRNGEWDGKQVDTIPIPETREHLKKILRRCKNNYQAVL